MAFARGGCYVRFMAWRFSDGTVVATGGRVAGGSPFAVFLRDALRRHRRGELQPVGVVPPPAGDVDLDLGSAWLLDRWLRQQVEWWNRCRAPRPLSMSSDYTPRLADAPRRVRLMVRENEREQRRPAPPGTVY